MYHPSLFQLRFTDYLYCQIVRLEGLYPNSRVVITNTNTPSIYGPSPELYLSPDRTLGTKPTLYEILYLDAKSLHAEAVSKMEAEISDLHRQLKKAQVALLS